MQIGVQTARRPMIDLHGETCSDNVFVQGHNGYPLTCLMGGQVERVVG